jgi:hypothetical protein
MLFQQYAYLSIRFNFTKINAKKKSPKTIVNTKRLNFFI